MGVMTALREDFYPATLGELPTTPGFTIGAASIAAWASQAAYEVDDENKFKRIVVDRWGWKDVQIIRGQFSSRLTLPSTKGFVATTSSDTTLIAVAGTEPTSLLNWFSDLAIHKTSEGVHSGFDNGALAVRDAIAAIIKPERAARNILLAGHSLGAAIVAMIAFRLLEAKLTPSRLVGVYTIGMPRLGDAGFAKRYNAAGGGSLGDRTYRLVNGLDVVPHVPPSECPFNFRHVGTVLNCRPAGFFPNDVAPQQADDDPVSGADPFRHLLEALMAGPDTADPVLPPYPGERLVARLFVDHSPQSVRDHMPDRYLRALRATK